MKYISIFAIIFLVGCSNEKNEQIFSAITNFKLDSTAVNENDAIKVIFASDADDANPQQNRLIQFVAINLTTKDTVNILCFRSNFLNHNDGDKVFHFKPLNQNEQDRIYNSIELSKKVFNIDSL